MWNFRNLFDFSKYFRVIFHRDHCINFGILGMMVAIVVGFRNHLRTKQVNVKRKDNYSLYKNIVIEESTWTKYEFLNASLLGSRESLLE